MRLYLDNCCLQRPLDDQTHPRIRVETEAVFAILAAIQSGDHQLISSIALEYEIGRIPDDDRRAEVLSVLTLATERLEISDDVEAAALVIEQSGISAMDAIHLALASEAKADYFCTCDDVLFRKAQALANLNCRVITLLGLVPEVSK
jgi:predicted nucleic acid-binding protein